MQGKTSKKDKVISAIIGIVTGVTTTLVLSFYLLSRLTDNGAEATLDLLGVHDIVFTKSENEVIDEKAQNIINIISNYYIEDVDKDLIKTGIYRGLVAELGDKYSGYLTEEEYNRMLKEEHGSYFGIGVQMTQNLETGDIHITRIYKGSPAKEAGLKEKDRIVEIDGEAIEGKDVTEITSTITGENGTTVNIKIARENEVTQEEDLLSFDVERRDVTVNRVDANILGDESDIGYLKIWDFEDNTAAQFKGAMKALENRGIEKLIIDLRDNPGGSVKSAIEVIDYLVPEGTIMELKGKSETSIINEVYKSSGESYTTMKIVVLINENTASAAELMAGNLRDYKMATLIGVKTYGKGIAQSVIPLIDGSALKLTTARYYLPSGECIHEIGIKPDIESKDRKSDSYDKTLNKAISLLQEGD